MNKQMLIGVAVGVALAVVARKIAQLDMITTKIGLKQFFKKTKRKKGKKYASNL